MSKRRQDDRNRANSSYGESWGVHGEEQGSCGVKPLKTKGKCRCWEAGWLHNSGKLLFTQIKPAGLLERLCVFLVQRRFCFHLYQCTAAFAACGCTRNTNVIVVGCRLQGRAWEGGAALLKPDRVLQPRETDGQK